MKACLAIGNLGTGAPSSWLFCMLSKEVGIDDIGECFDVTSISSWWPVQASKFVPQGSRVWRRVLTDRYLLDKDVPITSERIAQCGRSLARRVMRKAPLQLICGERGTYHELPLRCMQAYYDVHMQPFVDGFESPMTLMITNTVPGDGQYW